MKKFEDEVKVLEAMVRQISIEDWLACDIDAAITYAREKGVQVYDLTDEEKQKFIRMDMQQRGVV